MVLIQQALVFVEKWESAAAGQAHSPPPHVRVASGRLGDFWPQSWRFIGMHLQRKST